MIGLRGRKRIGDNFTMESW